MAMARITNAISVRTVPKIRQASRKMPTRMESTRVTTKKQPAKSDCFHLKKLNIRRLQKPLIVLPTVQHIVHIDGIIFDLVDQQINAGKRVFAVLPFR